MTTILLFVTIWMSAAFVGSIGLGKLLFAASDRAPLMPVMTSPDQPARRDSA